MRGRVERAERPIAAIVIAPRGFVALWPVRATRVILVRALVARFETVRVFVVVRAATF